MRSLAVVAATSGLDSMSSADAVSVSVWIFGDGAQPQQDSVFYRFKHGQHLVFDKANNYPLSNLYVTMLQRLGLDAAKFSSSTGTMRGLEMA